MLLNLNLEADLNKAVVYLDKLTKDKAKIEIKRVNKKRTYSQNRYVHALFQLFASEFGWTLEESKSFIKFELGYTYSKNNHIFLAKTSQMDTKDLSVFVDKFRNYSSAQGLYLPSADEFNENYFDYAKEIERAEVAEKRYGY